MIPVIDFNWFFIQRLIFLFNNFLKKDFQKWIGYVDVKSAPVHFYVQRNTKFDTSYTPIPFNFARVNEGNAMNLQTGKFTAPRPGIYFFSFTGLAGFPTSSLYVALSVSLYLNGEKIGTGWVEEANTPEYSQWSPLTLQSTLNLKSIDQVWLEITAMSVGAYLYDDSFYYTHFTGFMLEEEIVASLWWFRFDYPKNYL